jgi:hypothetical protein
MSNTTQILDISTYRDDPNGLERKIDEMSQLRWTIAGILPGDSSHGSKIVFVHSDRPAFAPA